MLLNATRNSGGDSALRFASVPKESYLYGKRGLFIWQKRPLAVTQHSGLRQCQKRPIYMAKEAYFYGKRGLFIWQKRPIYMAKEAYLYGKRGLFIWQKRPIYMAKEAYLYGKRGLW